MKRSGALGIRVQNKYPALKRRRRDSCAPTGRGINRASLSRGYAIQQLTKTLAEAHAKRRALESQLAHVQALRNPTNAQPIKANPNKENTNYADLAAGALDFIEGNFTIHDVCRIVKDQYPELSDLEPNQFSSALWRLCHKANLIKQISKGTGLNPSVYMRDC